jgi:hypothetical protein
VTEQIPAFARINTVSAMQLSIHSCSQLAIDNKMSASMIDLQFSTEELPTRASIDAFTLKGSQEVTGKRRWGVFKGFGRHDLRNPRGTSFEATSVPNKTLTQGSISAPTSLPASSLKCGAE